MYRKRQRGGNFKGKKYQRSKPKKQEGGNVIRKARRTGRNLIGKVKNSKITRTMVNLGRSLGLLPTPMKPAIKQTPMKAAIKQTTTTVQKGGSMRRRMGPPKRQRNTIPGARYVMYHP
jgi:hypothetical protein